jgi:hypothetical protein
MPTQIIDTPDATITIEDRPSGDGLGSAWTIVYDPKPGTPLANAGTLGERAQQALAVNAAFLDKASPTNAEVLAQVRVLTRQQSATIRLLLGLLDTTSGT